MSRIEYLLQVSVAMTSTELHEIRRMSENDSDISVNHAQEIADAIGDRFGVLNGEVVNQTPRSSQVGWSAPIRIPTAVHAK